jgi:secernin
MCDTFVVDRSATGDGSVIWAKNSDREANEAQALEFHAGRTYAAGSTLRCTYIAIPQVSRTRDIVICRPFWMWGAEMGVNAAGLAVGNEAVWTRMPLVREGRLTGMDLVRLALERADTSAQGVAVIAALLATHGQGGICGYADKRMCYHNSFLLADPTEAWVLETAGDLWAARKVQGIYAISNRLTIGDDWEQGHSALEDAAAGPGSAATRERPDFARAYSDRFYSFFSAAARRRAQVECRLREAWGQIDVTLAMRILQDHGADDYRPQRHFLGDRICAHAANGLTRNATQTTGSLVAHLKPGGPTIWVTGTSAPCLSLFKPVWFDGPVLPAIGPTPGARFDSESLWWRHEELHRRVLLNFTEGVRRIDAGRKHFQARLLAEEAAQPRRPSFAFCAEAFGADRERTEACLQDLRAGPPLKPRMGFAYRRYWARLNRAAGIALDVRGGMRIAEIDPGDG